MVWDGVGGNRLGWAELPGTLRAAIEAALGSAVVGAVDQAGGFSPGCAARLRLADGRRVFAKAMTAAQHPDSLAFYRREIGIAGRLPAHVAAPRLLWSDDGDDGVVLVFEDVEANSPPLPWRAADWARVHDAVVALARALTPSPVDLPAAADDVYRGWRSLAGDPALAATLDPWSRANLERLAELETGWPAAVVGDTLVHGDLRADNVLLAGERVVFVDWPQAMAGAPWLDLLLHAAERGHAGRAGPGGGLAHVAPGTRRRPGRGRRGAGRARRVLRARRRCCRRRPGCRRCGEFQRLQGESALAWLRSRLS